MIRFVTELALMLAIMMWAGYFWTAAKTPERSWIYQHCVTDYALDHNPCYQELIIHEKND